MNNETTIKQYNYDVYTMITNEKGHKPQKIGNARKARKHGFEIVLNCLPINGRLFLMKGIGKE